MTRKATPFTTLNLVFALGTEASEAINCAELKFPEFPDTSESADARVDEPCPKTTGIDLTTLLRLRVFAWVPSPWVDLRVFAWVPVPSVDLEIGESSVSGVEC